MSPSPPLTLSKYIPPLTQQQLLLLQRLASLQFQNFNESDVRDDFLVPLIDLLGYQKNSGYDVLREQSYALNPLFLTVGSKRIKLDYQFNIYKAGFWLLEAKKGRCSDPSNPPSISDDMIEQAHFYAHHREIDCPLFGVSNGWWTNLYDRDAEDPTKPVVSVPHHELRSRFGELYGFIGAMQINFWIKQRLLRRIEQVLNGDVDLARMDEFLRAANDAAQRAKPKVLENFRHNARIQTEAQSASFTGYLEHSRPYEIVDTLFLWPLNMCSMRTAGAIMARKVAQYPGSNQLLFFHKLLVAEPRPVTMPYYHNALHLLGSLCRVPDLAQVDYPIADGKRSTAITSLYIDFARLLLFHLSARPELRVLWAMEGLLKRMTKRFLLSSETARHEIAAGVDLQRYFKREEEIAYLGPSPARTIIDVIQNVALAELGLFFNRHYKRPEHREFDVRGALEEFEARRKKFESLEADTDAEYQALVKHLGQEWSELTWSDHVNRTWDFLGHGVCEVLLLYPEFLPLFPQDVRDRLVELARLGNTFARKCAETLGILVPEDYPDATTRLRKIFDPASRG